MAAQHYVRDVDYYGLFMRVETVISHQPNPGTLSSEIVSIPGYSALVELGLVPQILWAAEAYALGRQPLRKHAEDPYIFHPLSVAMAADDLGMSRNLIEAALFHDIVEDTDFTVADIASLWGQNVARYVGYMTEVPTEGNRAERKSRELARLVHWGGPDLQTLKILDLWDNARSIFAHEGFAKFAPVFLREAVALADALTLADPNALDMLWAEIRAWRARKTWRAEA